MGEMNRLALLMLAVMAQACSQPEPAATTPHVVQSLATPPLATKAAAPTPQATVHGDPLGIRFESFSPNDGLLLSITTRGDSDGKTTFTNHSFFSYNAPQYAESVQVSSNGKPLTVTRDKSGWTAAHPSGAQLTVRYRLLPSKPTTIDAGVNEWVRPSISDGAFHLVGDTALLLPAGRNGSDLIALSIDATPIVDNQRFVSSFAPGATLAPVSVRRREIGRALYAGGDISLAVHRGPSGEVGVLYSAMDSRVLAEDLRKDVVDVIGAVRDFVQDSQPWYLVSVRGGPRNNRHLKLGGGTGLTNSFVMFVTRDLDFSNAEDREQFRWVLAHEYFHVWNGQSIRVASLPHRDADNTSVYWFSEGVTEFYAMRLLTRAGLQSPRRALDVLNDKLNRYASNRRRDMGAEDVGPLYYSDPDADQIPYLRGYLAAWRTDVAMRRASGGRRSLDDAVLDLIKRAKANPAFRVDNAFLVSYLNKGLPAKDAEALSQLIISGGEVPFDEHTFTPCLRGVQGTGERRDAWTYVFTDNANQSCFRH